MKYEGDWSSLAFIAEDEEDKELLKKLLEKLADHEGITIIDEPGKYEVDFSHYF